MTSKKKSNKELSFFKRPLFGLMYWHRIDIADGLDKSSKIFLAAKNAAENHTRPVLPAFEFTESNLRWVLLYDLARKGQITPKVMRNMHRRDLHYLAGHTFPHPALTQPKDKAKSKKTASLPGYLDLPQYFNYGVVREYDDSAQRWDQATKLQSNAIRAQEELKYRNFVWTGLISVLAALTGGILSGNLFS